MAKQQSTAKSATQEATKPAKLFYLEAAPGYPQMDTNPAFQYAFPELRLKQQIENLETIEALGAIDEENKTVMAICSAITAVIERLEDIHENLQETNKLLRPWPADSKGGAE